MDTSFRLFPESASTAAPLVDRLYFFLLAVSAFFTILICVLIVYFALKYRRRSQTEVRFDPHPEPEDQLREEEGRPTGERFWILEITWSVIPLALTMVMFGWGAALFTHNMQAPPDSIEVHVLGKQWMWKVHHANGKREIDSLHVPVGRPVKLRMISEDVIHSFFVPAFRVKQDVLPGRYTELWFEPTKPGRYHLFCAEYCGTSHSRMRGEVVVLEPADYADWVQGGTFETLEAAGEKLFERFRCGSCHSGAQNARCPPLDGIYGRTVRLADGSTVIADDNYLRESIIDPTAKIVAGYRPEMPTYEPHKEEIGEEGIMQLVAYLKSLPAQGTTPRGNGEAQNEAPREAENQQ
jgi:cytochrome c oxidase subunit II